MAKATVLVCDRCGSQDGVSTWVLRQGHEKAISIDLCAEHGEVLVELLEAAPASKPRVRDIPATEADIERAKREARPARAKGRR